MTVVLLKRLLILAASLIVCSIVVFAFMRVMPGNPAQVALGMNASEQAITALNHEFGLDQPLTVQYFNWIGQLVQFDLGRSYVTEADIAQQILGRFQVTVWLVVIAMLIAIMFALPLGIFMAVRHQRVSGFALSVLSQAGIAVPEFLAGILLVAVFAVQLGWLPSNGWVPPTENPVAFVERLIMPALSLALVQGSILTRYVRSSVLTVMREDYIRTARAKGLRPMQALVRHGLRNAAIPVTTMLALQLVTLLIGAIVVEQVFVIPGLGSLLFDAVSNRDLIMVQDIVMLVVTAVLVVNFLVDVLYQVLDPRVRS